MISWICRKALSLLLAPAEQDRDQRYDDRHEGEGDPDKVLVLGEPGHALLPHGTATVIVASPGNSGTPCHLEIGNGPRTRDVRRHLTARETGEAILTGGQAAGRKAVDGWAAAVVRGATTTVYSRDTGRNWPVRSSVRPH
jgi:hypothetical protein